MEGTSRGVAGGILTTLLLLLLAVLLQHHPLAEAAGEAAGEDVQYRRHRRIRRRDAPPRTPTTPPVHPSRPVHPASPPPPPPTPSCNDTFAPEEFPTASGDVCTPVPPSPPPPPVVQPPRGIVQCPPCRCSCPAPKPLPLPLPPRPFPGWPWPVPVQRPVPVPGRGGSNPGANSGAGIDCVTPLSALSPCAAFVTANETETPSGECCNGIGRFLRTASASAAAGRGDHVLQCLCPVILGDVNKILLKPIDPLRLMYLPIACGIVLPPQLLYDCFTGRPSPVVTNFPESWGRDSASP